jgi:lysine-N-methylase
MSLPLQLPTIQNWSCHVCGGCCRKHEIEVTPEEKARIESQNWPASGELPADQPVFVAMGRSGKRFRLAHQADGACVFLNEQGLCRIHAKFGEPTKPLACRMFPYTFHPGGKRILVGYRFSCPSVAANKGKLVAANDRDLKTLQNDTVPEGAAKIPAPQVSPGEQLSWPDTFVIVEALERLAGDRSKPLIRRLLELNVIAGLLAQARFEKIQGPRVGELMQVLLDNVPHELPEDLGTIPKPSSLGRLQFRQHAAQYARRDTFVEARQSWAFRWQLFRAAVSYAMGSGKTPQMPSGYAPVPYADLDLPGGPITPEMDELITRYLRVKIQSQSFCGLAFYEQPIAEGLRALLLVVGVFFWLAKWRFRADGRTEWTFDDLAHAVTVADHHHGYSPALGGRTFRSRVRQLAEMEQIAPLLVQMLT